MRVCAAFLALVALLSSAPAVAQIVQEPEKIVYARETKLTFGPGEVEGKLLRPPLGDMGVKPKAAPFDSLIKVRASFDRELNESLAKL